MFSHDEKSALIYLKPKRKHTFVLYLNHLASNWSLDRCFFLMEEPFQLQLYYLFPREWILLLKELAIPYLRQVTFSDV